MNLILPIVSLFLPLALWPVGFWLGYPHVVEEVAKAILVWLVLTNISSTSRLPTLLLIGAGFTLSETVLYIFNLSALSSSWWLVTRLAATLALHSLTLLVMYVLARKHRLLLGVGLLLAIGLHYYYNLGLAPALATLLLRI